MHPARKIDIDLARLVKPHLAPKKDRHPLHKLFSYPAKFQGYLPEVLIENLTAPGALICDPYSGGGTTAASAAILGRRCYAMDLNAIAVLVSKAKSQKLSAAQMTKALAELDRLKPFKKRSFLTSEEWDLIGQDLGGFIESTCDYVFSSAGAAPLIATILIKRIKLACRRDKAHLRTATPRAHLQYLMDELAAAREAFAEVTAFGRVTVELGSNHQMSLRDQSADLVVTSPPYPGVDVEYNLIQLQRRDLGRCFRSNIGVRIAETVLRAGAAPSKKDLCDGGSAGDYWGNTERSLTEMHRVLRKGAFAFLYIGFKSQLDRKRFERLGENSGFTIAESFRVELGKERVASSRGLFHGRDTSMMACDRLYALLNL